MSELAIHEPRSFKVCLQLCNYREDGSKEGSKEQGRKTGGSRDTGRNAGTDKV